MREAIAFSFIILLQRETHSKYTMSAVFFCFLFFVFRLPNHFQSESMRRVIFYIYRTVNKSHEMSKTNNECPTGELKLSSAPQSCVVVQKPLQTPHSCTARYVPSLHFSGGAKTVFTYYSRK